MKYECFNCEELTIDKNTVMVFDDDEKELIPYCIDCWKIMNCSGDKKIGFRK